MGYRSGLEVSAAKQLQKDAVEFEYESNDCKFIYYKKVVNGRLVTIPEFDEVKAPKGWKIKQKCTYTCDFLITKKNGEKLFIETKGRFKPSDRAKHLLLQEQHPDADIRIVFSSNGVVKKNKNGVHYRNADWAEDNGFKYHIVKGKDDFIIPRGWYNE